MQRWKMYNGDREERKRKRDKTIDAISNCCRTTLTLKDLAALPPCSPLCVDWGLSVDQADKIVKDLVDVYPCSCRGLIERRSAPLC